MNFHAPALAALAFGLASAMAPAQAETRCGPSGDPQTERCVSGVPAARLAGLRQTQRASNWCWAASISMVLRSHGMRVAQEQIVRTRFGADVNMGLSAGDLGGLLNRAWDDASGQGWTVSALPLPPWRRREGIAAPEVVEDLDQGKPLILGAQQHAVVLVQLVYDRPVDPSIAWRTGIRPVRAVVLDPATEPGVRSARPAEWQPEYLARVQAEPRPAGAPPPALRLAVQSAAAAGPLLQGAGHEITPAAR